MAGANPETPMQSLIMDRNRTVTAEFVHQELDAESGAGREAIGTISPGIGMFSYLNGRYANMHR